MIAELVKRPLLLAVVSFLLGAALVGLIWGVSSGWNAEPQATVESPSDFSPGRTPEPAPSPDASAAAPSSSTSPADCPDATVDVKNADELTDALADAAPGDVIVLADNHYVGEFVATNSGTADARITLCGSADAVLDGGDWGGDYVLHLDGAKHWHLLGFTVRNGQKGVMADGTVGSIIERLTVFHIGDEAIHLRNTPPTTWSRQRHQRHRPAARQVRRGRLHRQRRQQLV